MKKIVVMILALAMVLSLAACGSAKSEETSKAEASSAAQTSTAAEATSAAEEATSAAAEASSAAAEASSAAAETTDAEWPVGDVTILVPADVGSPLDLATRVMSDYLTEATGHTFVVENDGTGGGAKVADTLYEAPKDGSVLMYCGGGQVPSYYNGSWAHNIANPDDYTIISSMVGLAVPSGAVMVTQPDKPFNTWPELVEYIKANPNTLTVAIANGTPHEIRMKLLFRQEGITDMVRWISGTNNDISTGLLGGNIDIGMLTETAGPQYIHEGDLKGLIYSNWLRNYADNELKAVLDEIPTVADIYGDELAPSLCCAWPMALAGPAGMDEALCDKITAAVNSIVDSEEYMQRVSELGGTNTFQDFSREEMREMMNAVDEQVKAFYAES